MVVNGLETTEDLWKSVLFPIDKVVFEQHEFALWDVYFRRLLEVVGNIGSKGKLKSSLVNIKGEKSDSEIIMYNFHYLTSHFADSPSN